MNNITPHFEDVLTTISAGQPFGIAHSGNKAGAVAGDPMIGVILADQSYVIPAGAIVLPDHTAIATVILAQNGLINAVRVNGALLAQTAAALGVALNDGYFIEAQANSTHRSAALNASLNRLLGAVLLGGRPARRARLHAFVPMHYAPAADAAREDQASAYADMHQMLRTSAFNSTNQANPNGISLSSNAKGAHYFLPHTHKLLLQNAGANPTSNDWDERIVTLDWAGAETLAMVAHRTKRAHELSAPICATRLHLYTERTMALEYELAWAPPNTATYLCQPNEQSGLDPVPYGDSLWHDIVLRGVDGPRYSVAAWLDFAEAARTLYSGFRADTATEWAKGFSTKLIKKDLVTGSTELVGTKLSAWSNLGPLDAYNRQPLQGAVAFLLRQFFTAAEISETADSAHFELRTDDRARIVQSLVPSGDWPTEGPAKEQLPVLESRLAIVDEFGHRHFYQKEFAEAEANSMCYHRFRGPDGYDGGSVYFANDHAFSHLGFGWFAAEVVSVDHVPGVYRRMALLLNLNAAALFGMLRDLGDVLSGWDAAQGVDDTRVEKLAEMHRRYLKFLNLNWQDQVSSQMQGIELYNLMLVASPASREKALVDDQISRTSEHVTARREMRRDGQGRFMSTMLAALALMIGLPGLLRDTGENSVQAAVNAMLGAGVAQGWAIEIAMAATIWFIALLDFLGLLGTPQRHAAPTGEHNWWDFTAPEWIRTWQVGGALALITAAPWMPLVAWWPSSASNVVVLLSIVALVAAVGIGFHTVWRRVTSPNRFDDRVPRGLGRIYALGLSAYALFVALRATGVVG